MTADNHDLQAIFNEAIARESNEDRAKYLDEACDDNPEVRQRVEKLLLAHSEAGGFFGGRSPQDATLIAPVSESPGDSIGPYKLLQQIGEGGMGTVYMAEQTYPVERRVALKIIKPGMDTRQVIARFEAERQALAMMDHPNIAKILDAGMTKTGRPYFVMELVKGMSVTEYCDQHQLPPTERLKLFISICQAVQHAHLKGIIHRDLKPSNILVAQYDDKAVPKIIDFGVAKAVSQKLTEKTMFTHYGQIVGTIEYMSPEQAQLNQLDIDTRSDIYSLGVLLYELLTGEMPFDRKRLRAAAFDEMLRIIREEEPPKPSTRLSSNETLASIAAKRQTEPKRLSLLVRGDLDWIVMKALEKDRGRRYETTSAFAEDVHRYLIGESVSAYPIGPMKKLLRWYLRHVSYFAAASTLLSFILLALMQVGNILVSFLVDHIQSLAGIAQSIVLIGIWLGLAACGVWSGYQSLAGKRIGLIVSSILFSLFSLMSLWGLYWSITTVWNNTLEPLVASSIIGYAVLGTVWMVGGLCLQVHALFRWKECTSAYRNTSRH